MRSKSNRYCLVFGVIFILSMFAAISCSKGNSEECVPPPESKEKTTKTKRTFQGHPIPNQDPNADWCRTCVLGPKGWASCQVAFAEKMGEDRTAIKERAREKACLDSGFKKGECPDSAVKAITCKDDPPPEGAEDPAQTLQKIFFKSKRGEDTGSESKGEGNNSSENSQ